MSTTQQIERAALRAHRRGACWAEFWSNYGHQTKAAEPYDRAKFNRLVARLLSLVTSGDTANTEPLPDLDRDDAQPQPHDTTTRARLLADAVPGVVLADTLPPHYGSFSAKTPLPRARGTVGVCNTVCL